MDNSDIRIEIQDQEAISLSRFLVLNEQVISRDRHMTLHLIVEFWRKDEQGNLLGKEIDLIDESDKSPEQKAVQRKAFLDQQITVTTRGSMVDPLTGDEVQPDENGDYPEGSIPELTFWQNLPNNVIPDTTKVSQIVYGLIERAMRNIDQKNRV